MRARVPRRGMSSAASALRAPLLVRLSSLTGVVEGGNGSTGWTYGGVTPGAGIGSQFANTADNFMRSGDGQFYCTLRVLSAGLTGAVGLALANNAAGYTAFAYGVYADNGQADAYQMISSGAAGGAPNGTALARVDGDVVRFRRAGTSIYCEVFRSSWTVLHTWTAASTAAIYPAVSIAGTNTRFDALTVR